MNIISYCPNPKRVGISTSPLTSVYLQEIKSSESCMKKVITLPTNVGVFVVGRIVRYPSKL